MALSRGLQAALEACGLARLREAGVLRVPEAYAWQDTPAFILLEWVEPDHTNDAKTLEHFIDEGACVPSMLHGDLWGGNYLVSEGEAVLIDPAVYCGQREVELAFTELFGGFPAAFYAGYNEVWPLPAEYADRKALYQLYPLLVHLNLFGEAYGGAVDRILNRYVGAR